MDLAIGPLDLSAHVDEALAVQAVAFGLGPDEVAVRRQIVLRHMTSPGARAFGATTPEGRLTGFVYGMPNDRTHWWSTVVEPYLRARDNDLWLDDSFVITELHVHPDHQSRGLGRRLLHALLADLPQPAALLSTPDADTKAFRLYHADGFVDLARGYHFPGDARPFAILGARLPLRPRESAPAAR